MENEKNIDTDRKGLQVIDPLQSYLNKIRTYQSLSREEEIELAIRYKKTGDKEAAMKLVTSNLRLVVKIAFEFRTEFQNMLDLIQEGNYGLLKAVKRFDPFRKIKLSTYASYWIRAYIIKFLLDNWRLVKVGTTNVRRKLIYNLKDAERKLLESGSSTQDKVKLLAEKFGATEADIVDVQSSLGASDSSIDAPFKDDSSRTYAEVLEGEKFDYIEDLAEQEDKERLENALNDFRKTLKPSDLTILDKRILSEDPLTLNTIGELYNVTRESIRQAETRLLKRLKTFLTERLQDE